LLEKASSHAAKAFKSALKLATEADVLNSVRASSGLAACAALVGRRDEV